MGTLEAMGAILLFLMLGMFKIYFRIQFLMSWHQNKSAKISFVYICLSYKIYMLVKYLIKIAFKSIKYNHI